MPQRSYWAGPRLARWKADSRARGHRAHVHSVLWTRRCTGCCASRAANIFGSSWFHMRPHVNLLLQAMTACRGSIQHNELSLPSGKETGANVPPPLAFSCPRISVGRRFWSLTRGFSRCFNVSSCVPDILLAPKGAGGSSLSSRLRSYPMISRFRLHSRPVASSLGPCRPLLTRGYVCHPVSARARTGRNPLGNAQPLPQVLVVPLRPRHTSPDRVRGLCQGPVEPGLGLVPEELLHRIQLLLG